MALVRTRVAIVAAMGVLLVVLAGGVFDVAQPALFPVPLVVGAVVLVAMPLTRLVRTVADVGGIVVAVVLAVVLDGGTPGEAWPGVLRGPRRLLTTEWPSPSEPTVVAAIALLIAVAVTLAAVLATENRLHLSPLVPVVVAVAALLALGAPVEPAGWLLVGLGLLAFALGLARHGEPIGIRGRAVLSDRTVAVTGVALAVATVATSAAIAWTDRADPRRTEEAELTLTLLDPIEAMVALRQSDPGFVVFRVTDRSRLAGPSLPARWRLAALESYDGQRWVPRLTLRPIGGRLGIPTAPSPATAPPIRYDVELATDDIDLLPFPGRPLEVGAAVETDLERVVVRLAERPQPGQVIAAVSEVAPTVAAARTAVPSVRPVDEIAGSFAEQAAELAGEDGTVPERLQRIESTMRNVWQLDARAPGAGQQLALIERFVTETRRGTREQFVTAYVLLVRSLGFDARVATGFVVPPDELGSPLVLESRHASVWPEVHVEDVGWLPFDPVPATEAVDEDEPPPPPDAQTPAAAQPPIAPPAEEGDDAEESVTELDEGGGRWASVRRVLVRIGAVAGLGLLPVVAGIGAIVVAKWRRRRRRLRTAHPAALVRGAWANATDSLVDAGLTIAPAWTDDRIARRGVALATGAPHEMRRLAAMSTAMTFGPTEHAARLAADAAATASAIDAAIRADRTRWQRLRWRLSLRSFRRATRSPVVV